MILTQKSRDWKIERAPRDENAVDISSLVRADHYARWEKIKREQRPAESWWKRTHKGKSDV